MSQLRRLARNIRAVSHYRPSQLFHRAINRTRRKLASAAPGRMRVSLESTIAGIRPADGLGCPDSLRSFALDPEVSPPERAEELLSGRFTFIGTTRDVGEHPDWYWQRSTAPSHLWRFHMHYHRFVVDAVVGALRSPGEGAGRLLDRASAVLDDWRSSCRPGDGLSWDAAWSPYAASTRVLNACLARRLLEGSPGNSAEGLRSRLEALTAQSAAFVREWLEWDVGGNHLLRNAAALVAASRCFDGEPAREWHAVGQALAVAELERQILPDGFHEERTPAYHALLVEDLLLSGVQRTRPGVEPPLDGWISRLLATLGTVLHPDGHIALFNDSALGVTAPPRALRHLADGLQIPTAAASSDLPSTGYYRFTTAGDTLIFDAGLLGPDHLPAHAHCDALSFELSLGGERVVVDTGVDRYEAGPERDFQRGTAAHSTLQVADLEQGEPFGSFRMGRRPRVHGRRLNDHTVEGSHDGFRPHGDHRRRIQWSPGRGLSWVDTVEATTDVPVSVRLGLAPRITAHVEGSNVTLVTPRGTRLRMNAPEHGSLVIENGVYCERLGSSVTRTVVCWRGTAGRAIELRFTVEKTD